MAYKKRDCEICTKQFTPPHRKTVLSEGDNHLKYCAECRRIQKGALDGEQAHEGPTLHVGAPMRQVVFDLETWGLDRGWGVTLVGSFLIHGDNDGPKIRTFTLRDYAPWKEGRRSDDEELAREIFSLLEDCHIAYAHNGERFDVRWLRSVALKYELQMPKLKLIDPCQIAWNKYRIGRNSLEALADYLELPYGKMHVSPEVWRKALMDDDDESWNTLKERCESDVYLLNAVASRVTGDVGMVDFKGSWR